MRVLAPSLAFALFTSIAAPALADELDDLAHVAEAHPDDMKACDAFAAAAIKQKRYDEAIKRLKITVARVPDYPEGYYKLAYAYRAKREWADAADYYRRYIALNPSRSDTYFGLGAALQGLGDSKGAVAAYQKYVAIEKAPAKQRFVDEAWAELSKLSGTSPAGGGEAAVAGGGAAAGGGDAAALRAKADELRAQNKWTEAVPAYKRAIAADPGNLDLCNDLGNTYFALKQYSDAAQAFAAATQRDPSYALGWYNQAHALRKAERWRDAAEAYRQYIKLKPEDPDPYYGLGQTLKALGDSSGAIGAFQKYVGMERRPDEQKWVEKARAELQALEAAQQPPPKPVSGSGKIEEKSSADDAAAREKLDRELKRDAVLPPSDDDLRLMDPFQRGQLHDLKDPFHGAGDDIVDPFERPSSAMNANTPSAERLRQYGAALAAYRRALSRHAEEVAQRFDRGVASALANNGASSALRAWNSVPLDDSELSAARASVERIRKSLVTAANSTTSIR